MPQPGACGQNHVAKVVRCVRVWHSSQALNLLTRNK